MKIGSTPTLSFQIPFSIGLIESLKIVFKQEDNEILTKRKEDCSLSGNKISFVLSQEETFMFNYRKEVRIQLRIKTTGGKVLTSDIIHTTAGECLDQELL